MVNKLAPCYLCSLCPAFVNERSSCRVVAFIREMIFVCLMCFDHLSYGIVFLPKLVYPLFSVVLKMTFWRTWNFQLAIICLAEGIVYLRFFLFKAQFERLKSWAFQEKLSCFICLSSVRRSWRCQTLFFIFPEFCCCARNAVFFRCKLVGR